jgi:hypothetical protein
VSSRFHGLPPVLFSKTFRMGSVRRGIQVMCLRKSLKIMVGADGIEPPTFALQGPSLAPWCRLQWF